MSTFNSPICIILLLLKAFRFKLAQFIYVQWHVWERWQLDVRESNVHLSLQFYMYINMLPDMHGAKYRLVQKDRSKSTGCETFLFQIFNGTTDSRMNYFNVRCKIFQFNPHPIYIDELRVIILTFRTLNPKQTHRF